MDPAGAFRSGRAPVLAACIGDRHRIQGVSAVTS
jgi:hypothetical protein